MSGERPNLELYKMEYERAAARYEDIYKATWTNFSYLAAVSGAILAFGGDKLGKDVAGILASVPLLFWYWATFEPLNIYGDDVVQRLKELEGILKEFSAELKLFTKFAERTKDESPKTTGRILLISLLSVLIFLIIAITSAFIFKEFNWGPIVLFKNRFWFFVTIVLAILLTILCVQYKMLRVRYVIRLSFFALHMTVLALLSTYFFEKPQEQGETKAITITLKGDKGEVKFEGLDIEKLNELLKILSH